MFFFVKRNLRGLLENRLSAYRNECQKQRISNSGPNARKYPSLFLCLSSCNTDGDECVSVTLPLGWGEGVMLQKKKNVLLSHVRWKTQFSLTITATVPAWLEVSFGAHGGGGKGRVYRGLKMIPHGSCEAATGAILPKDAFLSSPRSYTFFNPQGGVMGTNVVRVAGSIWAESCGPENVHSWGWVWKKCNSLAP